MKTIKSLTIAVILAFSLVLISCSDNNEQALKNAGIELNQRDSVIAMQSYRCNYTFSYEVDTIDYCMVNGQKIDSIDITNAVYKFDVNGNGISWSPLRQIYLSPNIELKKYTTWECDSLISKIYIENTKNIGIIAKNGYRTSKGILNPKLTTKDVYRTIKVSSHKLEKNYINLYNVKML